MPIYEFHCPACNTIFSFFSARVETERRPDCPACGRPRLERRPSSFATLSPRGDGEADDDPLAALDEGALERAVESLADAGDDLDDPRKLAAALRGFGDESGLSPGPKMEALLARLDSGEDPESLEAEMESSEEDSLEDYFRLKRQLAAADRTRRTPKVDDELYFF